MESLKNELEMTSSKKKRTVNTSDVRKMNERIDQKKRTVKASDVRKLNERIDRIETVLESLDDALLRLNERVDEMQRDEIVEDRMWRYIYLHITDNILLPSITDGKEP